MCTCGRVGDRLERGMEFETGMEEAFNQLVHDRRVDALVLSDHRRPPSVPTSSGFESQRKGPLALVGPVTRENSSSVGLIEGHSFDEEQCRAFLARNQVGRVGLSFAAVPIVFSVRYAMLAGEIYLAVGAEQIVGALDGAVIALHADGYDEDTAGHWSALAIVQARRVARMSQDPTWAALFSGAPEDATASPSTDRHIVRLHAEIWSGGWLHL